MDYYQPDFELCLSRIKEFLDYKSKTDSKNLKAYMDWLIKNTLLSFEIHGNIQKYFFDELIENAKTRSNHVQSISNLNQIEYPDQVELDQEMMNSEFVDEKTKESFLKSNELIKKSKERRQKFNSELTIMMNDLINLEKEMDKKIYEEVLLEKSTIPLFENIYRPNFRDIDNKISYELMIELIKYAFSYLKIPGKNEIDFIREALARSNRKKFTYNKLDQAGGFFELMEPYEESLLLWIETNMKLLTFLEENRKNKNEA